MAENEIKEGLSIEEIDEIKFAFNKYDFNKTGKINPKQFIKEMNSMGLNIKAPLIYKIITEFDTEENEKNGGVPIDEVLNSMNNHLGNIQNEEGIKNMFDLFKENPDDKTLTLNELKNMASSFGIKISDEEIKNMLERASENGEELTIEEFYKVMVNKN